jgi:hypothetical protein
MVAVFTVWILPFATQAIGKCCLNHQLKVSQRVRRDLVAATDRVQKYIGMDAQFALSSFAEASSPEQKRIPGEGKNVLHSAGQSVIVVKITLRWMVRLANAVSLEVECSNQSCCGVLVLERASPRPFQLKTVTPAAYVGMHQVLTK